MAAFVVGVALALEVADPAAAVAEVAMLDTEDAAEDADEPPELLPTSVAFSVPHSWLFLQASWPSASFGFASTHCT